MVLGLEAQDLQYLAERLQMEYSEFMKFRIAFLHKKPCSLQMWQRFLSVMNSIVSIC